MPLVETRNLEEPLLLADIVDDDIEGSSHSSAPAASTESVRLNHATATLAATIVGAGIMALPRAFAVLGLGVGGVIFTLVFLLSRFSLAALVHAADATGEFSYDGLAGSQFGRIGKRSLSLAILMNNAGSMIVYLILIGDVLCGVAPDYSGLITNLVGIHDPSVLWISRPFVMAVLCIVALGPLLSLRNLGLLAPMSTVSVAVAGGFAAVVVGLAGIAAFQGALGDFRWLPSPAALGGPSLLREIAGFLSVLPVVTMSFVCHYNLLPLARSLERFTDRRIKLVIDRALLICTAVFAAVATSGVLLFGGDTQGNILINLTPEAVSKLIPIQAAQVLCFAIRSGYCLCLVSTFAMLNWALRATVIKLTLGIEVQNTTLHSFLTISYIILAVCYGVSIAFPSVWTAMSLTGATAAVFLAYILPGALAAKVESRERWRRSVGIACVCLGVIMSIVGTLHTLLSR